MMTECERIVSKGILPVDFFQPETICDFLVDADRKKVWAVCIDLLIKFDAVCRNHGLRYFVAYGSLLGIVRHQGFIPWDDDIDVCMPREDYERLKGLKEEFETPYYLQMPGDNGYYFSYAKLRNSNTSGISKAFLYENFNQGMFLDIYPVDNCKPEYAEKNWNIINNLNLHSSANMRRSLLNPSPLDIERMNHYPPCDGMGLLDQIEKTATQYNGENLEYGIVAVLTIYSAKKQTYRWQDVLDLMDVDFYGHKVMIPRHFSDVLKVTYNDYMKMPPAEQRGGWHSNTFISADIPYKEAIAKLKNQEL